MGAHLKEALKKFYVRLGNKLLFKDLYSLNQLALEMWGVMGYRGIDASILSRVVSGYRLFTPQQFDAFCTVLQLEKKEREHLEYALYLDNIERYGISLPPFHQLDYGVLDLFDSLLKKARDYRSEGKNDDQRSIAEIIEAYIEKLVRCVKKENFRNKMLDQLGMALVLKGNALGGVWLPQTVVNEVMGIVRRLFEISKQIKNPRYEASGNILLAYAYYVSGNYSSSSRFKSLYLHSINRAKRAYQVLPDNNAEKLFALRTLATSTIYLRDKEDFLRIKKTALDHLPKIPADTYFLNGINLYNAIAEGAAIFQTSDPFKIKEMAFNHFKVTLEGRRIHEVSETRSDLEMSLALKTKDKSDLKVRVEKALQIAKEENYVRHYKNIKKLAQRAFG
ncbi:hypothetical protein HYT33_01900 [Candidatus Roizmanbacteria bacterium]|nr:hypothetical protein [Candidatus Roizmanbacteria bacterium]